MSKRMLADVLWEASNLVQPHGDIGSCCLAYRAERGRSWFEDFEAWGRAARSSKSVQFLRELGCPVGSCYALDDHQAGETRQGVRYMWLLLAAKVAEDEGIEV